MDEPYVVARRVLLDALGPHREAVVLAARDLATRRPTFQGREVDVQVDLSSRRPAAPGRGCAPRHLRAT